MDVVRNIAAAIGLLALAALAVSPVVMMGYVYGATDGRLRALPMADGLPLLVALFGVALVVLAMTAEVLRRNDEDDRRLAPW